MEVEEFRAVIKHFYLKKWTAAQIEAELDEVHGDPALTLKTVFGLQRKMKRAQDVQLNWSR